MLRGCVPGASNVWLTKSVKVSGLQLDICSGESMQLTIECRVLRPNNCCRYGYHVPAVRKRDTYYAKLEEKRAADANA